MNVELSMGSMFAGFVASLIGFVGGWKARGKREAQRRADYLTIVGPYMEWRSDRED